MRRGKKPNTPAELKARGTFRPVRHKGLVEFDAATDLPQQPDWLTDAGRAAWADLIEHVVAARSATAADSLTLGTLANLLGASAQGLAGRRRAACGAPGGAAATGGALPRWGRGKSRRPP